MKPDAPYLQASAVLQQYLNTAACGHVFVEQSIALNRWRLCCEICKETLTFGENEDIATRYQQFSELDSSIQNFVNEHRHMPVKPVKKKESTWGELTPWHVPVTYKFEIGVSTIQGGRPATKLPRRTSGRKFRTV